MRNGTFLRGAGFAGPCAFALMTGVWSGPTGSRCFSVSMSTGAIIALNGPSWWRGRKLDDRRRPGRRCVAHNAGSLRVLVLKARRPVDEINWLSPPRSKAISMM